MRNYSNRFMLSILYLSYFLFPLQSNAEQMTSEETKELRKEALELIKDNKITQGEMLIITEDPETKRVLSSMPLTGEMGKKEVSSVWGGLQTFLNYGHGTANWAYHSAYNAGKYAYDNSPTIVQKGVDTAYNVGKHAYDKISSTMLYAGEKTYKFSKEHPYIATAIAGGAICLVGAGVVYVIYSGTIPSVSVLLTAGSASAQAAVAKDLTDMYIDLPVMHYGPERSRAIFAIISKFAKKYGFDLSYDGTSNLDQQTFIANFLMHNFENPYVSNKLANALWGIFTEAYAKPISN